ncbi:MAG TPA: hypothetical protein PLB16_10975 [bacterium]|nr:hypothetical protein [bacterium]
MANEMVKAIKGNDRLDIRAVAEAGDALVAANVAAVTSAITGLGTEVKGTGWTSGMTLKAHDDTIAGHTTTIGAHTTALSKLNGMYAIQFVGADADPDAAFCGEISVLTPGAVPAAGDKIIAVLSARATADMSPVAYPAIVDAATSNGFVQILEIDYGDSKVKVKQGAGSDLSANTYCALVLRA